MKCHFLHIFCKIGRVAGVWAALQIASVAWCWPMPADTHASADVGAAIQPYRQWQWRFHAVVDLNNTVYDSCAKYQYDLNGFDFYAEPTNWQWPAYWQTFWSGIAYGLCNGRVGLPNYPVIPVALVSTWNGIY